MKFEEEHEPIEQDDLPIILEVARNAMQRRSTRDNAAAAFDVEDSEIERAWIHLEAYCAKTSKHGHYEIKNGDDTELSFKPDELDAHIEECVRWLTGDCQLVWVEEKPPKKKK